MSESSSTSSGVSFFGLLAIAFIVLRLCGVIHWSWWWVLAPIWAPLAVLAVVLLIAGIVALRKP